MRRVQHTLSQQHIFPPGYSWIVINIKKKNPHRSGSIKKHEVKTIPTIDTTTAVRGIHGSKQCVLA